MRNKTLIGGVLIALMASAGGGCLRPQPRDPVPPRAAGREAARADAGSIRNAPARTQRADAQADARTDRRTAARAEPGTQRRAGTSAPRPAVLMIPADADETSRSPADRTTARSATRRRPSNSAAQRDASRRAAPDPRVDEGYAYWYSVTPDPRLPQVRYHVYVDLSDPMMAENWQRWHRAQQGELHRDDERRRDERDTVRRRQRLWHSHDEAVRAGHEQMRAGEYREALLAYTLAAELDHGDPACRICLGLARLALGHDAEAAQAIRRALELQPKLVPIPLNLPQYFPTPEDYDAQVDALAERVSQQDVGAAEVYFLLGYLEFQRGRYEEAHTAFKLAREGLPRDDRLQQYLTLTAPAKH